MSGADEIIGFRFELPEEVTSVLTNEEKKQQPDIPDLYLHFYANAYLFDQQITQYLTAEQARLLETRSSVGTWLLGRNKEQLLWFSANNDLNIDKTIILLKISSENSQVIEITLPDRQKSIALERFILFVTRFLSVEDTIKAVHLLDKLPITPNFEAELIKILVELFYQNTTHTDDIPTSFQELPKILKTVTPKYSWVDQEIEPLKFDLEPYLTNPIEKIETKTDSEIFEIIKERLATEAAEDTPDRLTLELQGKIVESTAEFINTQDVVGGVGTDSSWADLLLNRRPEQSIAKIAKMISRGKLAPPQGDELTLWRIKKDKNDSGRLFVMEGNHRIAVMRALGVTKFPAEVKTVILPY